MTLWPNSACLREKNPYHEPAGTAKGGQFAKRTGGAGTADTRLHVGVDDQIVTRRQVAFASLGARAYMYEPESGVLVLDRADTPERGWTGTHAGMFTELKPPGRYDDYVRGFVLSKRRDPTDVPELQIWSQGLAEGAEATGRRLRTVEYFIQAGAPPETRLSVVQEKGGRSVPGYAETLGEMFPELYGKKRKT